MNKILKIVIVIAIIVVLAVGSYILFRSIFEQRGIIEVAGEVSEQATGLGTQATDYVKGNIPMVTAYVGTATAAVGGVLAYKKSAESKVAAVTSTANSQIDGLLSEKDKLIGTVETQTGTITTLTTKVTNLEQTTSEAVIKAQTFETENKRLQTQYNELKDLIRVNGLKPDASDPRVALAAEEAARIA